MISVILDDSNNPDNSDQLKDTCPGKTYSDATFAELTDPNASGSTSIDSDCCNIYVSGRTTVATGQIYKIGIGTNDISYNNLVNPSFVIKVVGDFIKTYTHPL